MRISIRLASFLLSSVALFSSAHAAALQVAPGDAQVADPTAAADGTVQNVSLHDGSFIGGTYDAYYGTVQVQATIQSGQIVSVKALKFPNHSGTSRSINRQALPYLWQEVSAKQSAKVDIIGGATLTSRAYMRSLRDALAQSGK